MDKEAEMLILKAYVNERQIDEVHIHNVGTLMPNLCQYAVEKPDIRAERIAHFRSMPWYYLAREALEQICDAHEEGKEC